jgi:hypothetical protein
MNNIKISGKQDVEIEINEYTVKTITLNYLCNQFDWKLDYFIEEDKVKTRVEYHTSHSWYDVETVRPASPRDKHIYNVIKEIKNNTPK